jgi:DoxX-like family
MTKRNKIIYWIATVWLAFGMFSGGAAQLFKVKATVDGVTHLGYPVYFLTIIGIWKMLGAVAVLIPKFPILKEWAYAGFFFTMTGAIFSHLAGGDAAKEFFGPVLLLVLTLVSWYFRPMNRKTGSVNQ